MMDISRTLRQLADSGDRAAAPEEAVVGMAAIRRLEHALAALGFLALLCFAAFLIDHYTDGDRKLWREARYGCCP